MLFSIIIPVYNHAHKLEQCIESVLAQSLSANFSLRETGAPAPLSGKSGDGEIEIIVVNDGSTDDLGAKVTGYGLRVTQRGIRFEYVVQENKGAAVARNVGFDHSSGEYVFFCDADIRLQPDALEKMFGALKQNPGAAFAYCQFRLGFKTFHSFPFDPKRLRELNYIHTSSLIRRRWFPRFDESLKKFQDWDLFLTIAQKGGRGVFIPEVLYQVATGGTMSQWVPSFAYHLPWKWIGWQPKAIQKYDEAKSIIYAKHRIPSRKPGS